MLAHVSQYPSLRNESNSPGIIAAHPCKKRKDGAPSVGIVQCKDGPPAKDGAPSVEMLHIEMVKGGPPAQSSGGRTNYDSSRSL
jgi:hypothetical protein